MEAFRTFPSQVILIVDIPKNNRFIVLVKLTIEEKNAVAQYLKISAIQTDDTLNQALQDLLNLTLSNAGNVVARIVDAQSSDGKRIKQTVS